MPSNSVDPNRPSDEGVACAGCTLHDAVRDSRREFLREAGAGVVAVLAALAALGVPGSAHALEVGAMSASRVSGGRASYPLPSADGVSIDREREVILVRWQGAVYAFRLSCPHQNTALKWKEKDARFQCPKHKSKYQPDGTFVSGRATRGMDRYAVRRVMGEIEVNLEKVFHEDEDRAGWNAAKVSV